MWPIARSFYGRVNLLSTNSVNKIDYERTYSKLLNTLKRRYGSERAMQYVVGGNFDVLGFLELETLKYFGLEKSFYIIDVGCGSGRLAKPLSEFLEGKYLGIDIIPELVDHARRLAN